METEKSLVVETIEEYDTLAGRETKNPLVSLIKIKPNCVRKEPTVMKLGFYAVYLKSPIEQEGQSGTEESDHTNCTVTTYTPYSEIHVNATHASYEILGLYFSPTLIKGSTFGRHYSEYTYFQYTREEALFLTRYEKDLMLAIFSRIQDELEKDEDRNTTHILTDLVKFVLDLCLRFYDRQFATMHKQNYQITQQFLQNVNLYLNNGMAKKMGVPTISYFADLACTSPGYFSDIIKRETGVNIKKYIQYKVIEVAKQMLAANDRPINEIAEWLGFKYPQHFTRLFKHETGMSPRDFRKQRK